MKRVFLIVICLFMVIATFVSVPVFAQERAGGYYTQDDIKKEFRVYDADGLMSVAEIINNGGHSDYDIFIEADIDMGGKAWTPIADNPAAIYCGTVDGQGHTITGLSRQSYGKSIGFIAYARPGTVIKNLHLDGVNFSSNKAYNGGIIGRIDGTLNKGDYVLIEDCTVQGRLYTTANYAGGLVGAFTASIGSGEMIKDQYGSETEQELFYAPHLVVDNCAIDMVLSSDVNYACGIMAGDSYNKDTQFPTNTNFQIIQGDFPTITCKNVFVTGNYTSSGQASAFIGYTNLCTVYMESCLSTANIAGGDGWEGSFFTRIRKSNVTVKNCYSSSDLPFSGEIENLANFIDANGNILDGINIVNSYAAYACDKVTHKKMLTKLCSKLTTILKPIEPGADATDEEREKYYEDLALYNTLIIANINDQSYGLENVSDLNMGNNFDNIGSFTCTIVLPPKSQQEILDDIEAIIPTIFAQGSKQKELVDAFFVTSNCSHETIRELASSRYICTNATCTEQATYYKSCAICGKVMEETFSYGELASHTWTDRWSGDEINHFHVCTVCREATTDVAGHIFGEWEVVRPATFDYGGKEQRCCTACSFEQEREIPKLERPDEPSLECEHSYDGTWRTDNVNHWHVCTKCNKSTTAPEAHSIEVITVSEGTIVKITQECSVCKYIEKTTIVQTAPEQNDGVVSVQFAGCSSSVCGTGIVMLLVAIGAFVLRKKEG